MAGPSDEFADDWIHGMFEVFREEAISIAADFGSKVKREIDLVADSQSIRPPSATSLLTSVAIETGNMAMAPLTRSSTDDEDPAAEAESPSESDPEDTEEGDP